MITLFGEHQGKDLVCDTKANLREILQEFNFIWLLIFNLVIDEILGWYSRFVEVKDGDLFLVSLFGGTHHLLSVFAADEIIDLAIFR